MEEDSTAVNTPSHVPSSLLDYLPAIYRQEEFLGMFLLAFEKVLLGRKDGIEGQGLEETIAQLHRYFSPDQAPPEFLPWLAGWTAFSLRAELSDGELRGFLAKVIQSYRWRGTRRSMEGLLQVFAQGKPDVIEGSEPYRFHVRIRIGVDADAPNRRRYGEFIQRKRAIAHAVIELDKPAHTIFKEDDLQLIFPSFKIGEARIGEDTVIGNREH